MLDVPAVWAETAPVPPAGHVPAAHLAAPVARARALREALVAGGAREVPARPHDDSVLESVHDPAMLAHLAGARGAGGRGRDPDPFSYDTLSPVDVHTWTQVRGAVDATLTAVDLVASGEPVAYAVCPLPGLHAGRARYGRRCYVNNAALAATALRDAGAARVAILDVDAHHGAGSQSLFYERADVYYGSTHVEPEADDRGAGTGFAAERGTAAGTGTTRNVPLPSGTGDPGWLAGLAWIRAEAASFGADAVVLSLGVDAWQEDPRGPFAVTGSGFRTAGTLIRDLRLPVVAVTEGGFHVPSIGPLTVATLRGLAGRD